MATKDLPKIDADSLRKALRAWDSSPALGRHPLAGLQIVETRRQEAGYPNTLEDRGRALREVIRNAIHTFPAPAASDDIPDKAERSYAILTERFIKGRNWDYIAAQLGLGRRTYFEEQAQALETLVDILRRREEALATQPAPPSPQADLEVALARLAELPLNTLPDPGPLPAGSVMPLGRNPLFVGREQDLRTLAAALKGGETIAIGQLETAVTTGLGGIGKTQLACEFVHRYGRFFAGGVFWLSFAEAKAVPSEIAACGGPGRLNLRPNFSELSLEDQLNLVRAAWQEPAPRLLVFDNCEELELLQQWRPSSGGCRLLITSRRVTWAPVLGVQALPLDVLSREESLSLLQEHCPEVELDILEAIAEELGDLPLALHLAGSYLATYKRVITPAHYLAQLQSPALLEHLSFEGMGPSPTRHVSNIYRTMTLSYDKLDPDNPIDQVARQILACAACLAPGEPIPYNLLIETLHLPVGDLKAAIRAENSFKRLLELGLIILAAEDRVRLHRLVVAFIQDTIAEAVAASQEAVESALEQQAKLINQSGDPRPLLAWQPHLRAVTDVALARKDLQAAKLCNELGWHLWLTGDFNSSRRLFERALTIRQKILGEEHPETAHSLDRLGFLLRAQGRLDEAGPYFERALAIREKVLGEAHHDTAVSLNEMGRWWHLQGDITRARQYYERALVVSRTILGKNHPLTAEYLNNVGSCLQTSGDLSDALPYLQEALAINEGLYGLEHPDTALNLSNIGYLLRLLGEPVQAQSYHERALAVRLKLLGIEHPDTAVSLRNLGVALQDQGYLDQAQAHLERALEIHEKAEGEEHQQTAICVTYLGLLFQAKGELNTAQQHLERALSIRQKVLRKDSPLQAVSYIYLSSVLQAQGELNRAQAYLEQALAIRQKVFGKEHLLTGQNLNELGNVLKAQGEMTRAQSCYTQALVIFETQLGPAHEDTNKVRANLALFTV